MIFVTVGTHEQPFNRLIREIDYLKKDNIISDEVFIQLGYSDYQPEYCAFKKLISFEEMNYYINNSDIIITHGGPATFMKVLSEGKVPIVVPRQQKFSEHVNDHQLEFANHVIDKGYPIEVISEITKLKKSIKKVRNIENQASIYKSNNNFFVKQLQDEIKELLSELA